MGRILQGSGYSWVQLSWVDFWTKQVSLLALFLLFWALWVWKRHRKRVWRQIPVVSLVRDAFGKITDAFDPFSPCVFLAFGRFFVDIMLVSPSASVFFGCCWLPPKSNTLRNMDWPIYDDPVSPQVHSMKFSNCKDLKILGFTNGQICLFVTACARLAQWVAKFLGWE